MTSGGRFSYMQVNLRVKATTRDKAGVIPTEVWG
jgi:hypothetical protein